VAAVDEPTPQPLEVVSEPSHSLLQELFLHLKRQSRRVPLPIALVAVVAALLALRRAPAPLVALWWLAVCGALAARWIVLGRLPELTRLTDRLRLAIAIGLSAINGAVHGSVLFFFPLMTEIERALLTTLLIGLSVGAVGTTAGYMPIFLAFVLPVLGPTAVLWVFNPGIGAAGWDERSLGLFVAMFIALLCMLARDAFRTFKESFSIRLQQVDLNRQLRTALGDAERANRAKSRFLASASHDLRQPLHTLSLFGAALQMRPLDERTRDIATNMNAALRALASQLDALLDVSKLDAGVVKVDRTTILLAPLLARLHGEFEPLAQKKGLVLAMSCPPDLFADSDLLLLERVLRNLVDNAIKYTDKGSVSVLATRLEERIKVVVRDTGRGIPQYEHERVFEEFYQVDNPERDRTQGLGLGLAIVRRLVSMLEIDLALTSTPGTGTEISLLLRGLRDLGGVEASPCVASNPVPGHALVIDDEAAVREGMRTLLEGMGWTVSMASGIDDALRAASAAAPDFVFCDLRLRGGETGIEAIRCLRSRFPRVPALLITGDTAPNRLREAHDAGVPLLHKPISIETLNQAIEGERR
jgi:signal transduction histidine kinase/CheY-like chemotaxis protein